MAVDAEAAAVDAAEPGDGVRLDSRAPPRIPDAAPVARPDVPAIRHDGRLVAPGSQDLDLPLYLLAGARRAGSDRCGHAVERPASAEASGVGDNDNPDLFTMLAR